MFSVCGGNVYSRLEVQTYIWRSEVIVRRVTSRTQQLIQRTLQCSTNQYHNIRTSKRRCTDQSVVTCIVPLSCRETTDSFDVHWIHYCLVSSCGQDVIALLRRMPSDVQETHVTTSGWSRNFDRGGGARQCISLAVIYRKCTQRTICLLYGKRRLIEKKIWANRRRTNRRRSPPRAISHL